MSPIWHVISRWKPGRTFAQALAALLIADGAGLLDTDWPQQLSVAGMSGLLSFLSLWAQGQEQMAEDAQ